MTHANPSLAYEQQQASKAIVLGYVVALATLVLVARLTWLQILQNGYYKNRAVENSTRVTFLRAPRGVIYDRHGNLLATNKQTISLIAIPNQLEHCQELASRLAKIIDMPDAKVLNLLLHAK